jgi:hypothetical protein
MPTTKSTKPFPNLPGYSSFSLELTSGNVEPDPKNKFTSAFNQFVPDTTNPNARPRKPRKPYKKALIPNPRLRHPWEQHLTNFQSTHTSSTRSTTSTALALGSPAQVLSQFGQAQVLSQLSGDDSMDVDMESPKPSSSGPQSAELSSPGAAAVLSSSTSKFNRADTPPEHCDYMRAPKRSHDQAFPKIPSF